jgi:hypothetical protein
MNNHVASPIQQALAPFMPSAQPAAKPLYEAVAMFDGEGSREWFVRLLHHNQPKPEFCGLCAAESEVEAKLIATCVNAAVLAKDADAMRALAGMFDWKRFS